jgi:hypothetical protein
LRERPEDELFALRERPDEELFALRERPAVRLLFDLAGRAFAFFVDLARVVAPVDFFAPPRFDFAGRVDFKARFAAGTAARTVLTAAFAPLAVLRAPRLTAGRIGLPLSARLPRTAPRTPPTTAPTGPATAPTTAPVAAPAVVFGMGGISMFSFASAGESDDSVSLGIDFTRFLQAGRVATHPPRFDSHRARGRFFA